MHRTTAPRKEAQAGMGGQEGSAVERVDGGQDSGVGGDLDQASTARTANQTTITGPK